MTSGISLGALSGDGLAPPAAAQRGGLVIDRAQGTRRLYRLHDEGIEAQPARLGRRDAALRIAALMHADEPGGASWEDYASERL
jgi:hypothetical protein